MQTGVLLAALSGVAVPTASACPNCRIAVRDGIFNGSFTERLGITVAPFAGMAAVGYAVYWAARRKNTEDGR